MRGISVDIKQPRSRHQLMRCSAVVPRSAAARSMRGAAPHCLLLLVSRLVLIATAAAAFTAPEPAAQDPAPDAAYAASISRLGVMRMVILLRSIHTEGRGGRYCSRS